VKKRIKLVGVDWGFQTEVQGQSQILKGKEEKEKEDVERGVIPKT